MSVTEEISRRPQEAGEDLLSRPLIPALVADWEKLAFATLVLVAAAARFWDLGPRALHHDESLHALYSWYLYVGRGYVHDPLMHGPFQFHATALIYFLLGASDYTARVLPALLGTLVVALPYFLRRELGRTGALCAAALLAFSPSMLYYSRFLRNDVYVVAWNLLLLIAMWRFSATGSRRALLLGAAALSLGFATKEVTYLTVLIFGGYLLAASLPEVLPRLVRRFDFRDVSPRTGFLIVLGALSLPQGAAAALLVLDKLGIEKVALGADPATQRFLHPGSDPLKTFLLVAAAAVPLMALSALIAARWNWRLWLPAAGVFYGTFVVLFTTFFTNLPGFGTGIFGGLEYWLAQQDVQRGSQPWYYYLVLIPLNEFLPIVLSIAGLLYFGVKQRFRDEHARFLAWWALAALVLYSYAGEKMPWLSLHIVLPLILLGAKTLGEFLEQVPWSRLRGAQAPLAAALALLLPLALRALLLSGDPFQEGPGQNLRLLQALAAAAATAFLLGTLWQLAKAMGGRRTAQVLAATGLAVLAAFTVRAAWQASYAHGDIPVEMLVYTQTSPEVPAVLKNIERIGSETGQGKELPVTVDANEGFTWPWAWYLRDYKNVDYPSLNTAPGEPRGKVLLLNANSQKAMEPFLGNFDQGQRFPHRWWFPEEYRNLTLEGVLSSLTDPGFWPKWWAYFYNRDIGRPLGSSDALAYYAKGSAGAPAASGQPPVSRPVDPLPASVQVPSDLVLGAGTLRTPKGLTGDAQGNLYVVDEANARLLKLDPTGRVLAQVGRSGSGDGEFNQPWGVAVDKAGNVYVADTWNHRVQKFDRELKFVAKWGGFANVSDARQSPGSFFGPRDIAIDAAGNLLVTDTGNKRVQKLSPSGEVLGVFGQSGRDRGQFLEPVGIAISPSGEILVADTWNRRVQRFDAEFRYRGEFPVQGWAGQGVLNKPYIAADSKGNVLVTDPESHRIIKYTSAGVVLKVYGRLGADNSSFNLPAAVWVDSRDRVFASDSANGRVLRFPPLE